LQGLARRGPLLAGAAAALPTASEPGASPLGSAGTTASRYRDKSSGAARRPVRMMHTYVMLRQARPPYPSGAP